MFELLVIGALVMVGLAVIGLVWSLFSLIYWVLVLPFKLLGLVFKGLGVLLAVPFLLIAGVLAAALFGVGLLLFLTPALPLVLLVLAVVWLMRRGSRSAARPA